MRVALLTDIHGNRPALETCLADVARVGVDVKVFLGDLVGYGADPEFIVETVAGERDKGAIVLRGNHDEAAATMLAGMSDTAAKAIAWTREHLSPAAVAFLKDLPLQVLDGDILYVHASAKDPLKWHYIVDSSSAEASLEATPARLTFCGHTHDPGMWHRLPGRPAEFFRPLSGRAVPLSKLRQWLTVVGSVGQPRDRNPQAGWGLLDTETNAYTQMRVAYDVEAAARRIIEAGLPPWLGERLTMGR